MPQSIPVGLLLTMALTLPFLVTVNVGGGVVVGATGFAGPLPPSQLPTTVIAAKSPVILRMFPYPRSGPQAPIRERHHENSDTWAPDPPNCLTWTFPRDRANDLSCQYGVRVFTLTDGSTQINGKPRLVNGFELR